MYLRSFANTYVTGFVKSRRGNFNLTPNPEVVHVIFDPVFTDDETIYFITDYESEYSYVAKFNLATKEIY